MLFGKVVRGSVVCSSVLGTGDPDEAEDGDVSEVSICSGNNVSDSEGRTGFVLGSRDVWLSMGFTSSI
jgi:hypothetical protein